MVLSLSLQLWVPARLRMLQVEHYKRLYLLICDDRDMYIATLIGGRSSNHKVTKL